ncbi:MAG: sodium:solute symporter family protein [Acidobacteriota bacterium]|nr:MAG: sodium:solute symporter family protein [Acidobacteriota bacterium]
MNFSIIDWLIVAVYLAGIFYLGVRGKRYVKDSADFLVAGRSMGLHVGMISLVATEIGIITFMYYAEMGVIFGFTACLAGVITAAVYIGVGRSGFVIGRFREMELVTVPQYFEQKYGSDVRILVGVLMAVGGALNFGVFPIIEATFLNITTGIPQEYILWTMVVLILVVLAYTALGGMVSVIITSYVQYIVLLAAMLLITFYCFYSVGWSSMVETVQTEMGQQGFDPFSHPTFGWKFILWQTLNWLALVTVWAPIAARAFSSEDTKTVKKIFTWTGLLALGRAVLPFLWGIAALAYLGGKVVTPIEATPQFLRDVLPIGIIGLVVAGMLAASMSTYSGYLLAWSSIISEDVVLPLVRRKLRSKTRLRINQVTVLLLALFIIIWGLFYIIPGATYFYLQMTASIFLAGTFWAVVGGLYWKKAHRLGAYCSLIFGAACTLIYFLVPDPRDWTGTIGVLSYFAAFTGMVAGSLVGHYVVSRVKRFAILAALIVVIPLAARYIQFTFTEGRLWQDVWSAVLVAAGVLMLSLSSLAIVKGFSDIKRMFSALMGDKNDSSPSSVSDE